MKKFLFVILITPLILLLLKSEASAAILGKVHNREFVVRDEYLEVTESKNSYFLVPGYQLSAGSIEAFTIFNPIEGDPEAETKLQDTLNSIIITDQFGTSLDYTVEKTDSKNNVVKVTIPFAVNYIQNSVITLKYNSYGLIVNSGAVKDLYIPGFPADYSFESDTSSEEVNTTIKIPNTLPEINFISPEYEIRDNGEFREIYIPKEGLLGQSTWIQIGKEQFFEFSIEQDFSKTSPIPLVKNTFFIPLPRDIKSGPITQKVYYTEFNPKPFAIKKDENENLIALFKAPSNSTGKITIKGFASLFQESNFSIDKGGELSEIPQSIKDQYLNEGKYWEVSDPKIITTASEIKGASTDVYEITKNTYEYVVNLIDYSFVKKYGINERQGALKTLNGGSAVCMEYSDLFITLMRAQGVPARAAFGFGFGSLDYEARSDADINHQWAEVYIPTTNSWVNVDTTWGEFGNSIIGGDLNHFYSHVTSIDPETPSTTEVSFFGTLGEIPKREMKINVISDLTHFDTNTAMTQDELLTTYKDEKTLEQLNAYSEMMDDWIADTLNIENENIILLIKVIILTLPVIIIIFLIFNRIISSRNSKKVKI